ncbi:Golgi-associated plant pathogenesis-related protein 1-like isoform X2 [Styela clava]|uniref:Golgi-associated plant pathogenesis-related protein 1-like isoform X2 n=1 Tax=Styela clava TaxID=7725 RepID=UPI00193958E2|nr:Golgi-associated plant pathogenesis-related protein 1-like isoform X2 [Styela clava]
MGNCFNKQDKRKEEDRAPAPAGDDSFAAQLLKAQNVYRKQHGVPPLTLNAEMSKDAQIWAERLAKRGQLEHADTDLGENLAMRSPELSGQDAAKMWYDEIQYYDFSNPGYKGGTGHFTQVVWKSSKEFGAGIAKASNGGLYAVGRYKPAGNVTNPGFFEENVLKAK